MRLYVGKVPIIQHHRFQSRRAGDHPCDSSGFHARSPLRLRFNPDVREIIRATKYYKFIDKNNRGYNDFEFQSRRAGDHPCDMVPWASATTMLIQCFNPDVREIIRATEIMMPPTMVSMMRFNPDVREIIRATSTRSKISGPQAR